MLTKKQQRSVVRALTLAYFAHRDLPLLQVCRKNRIRLWSDPKDDTGGSCEPLPDQNEIYRKYCCQINIPGKRDVPPDYKEFVFWHEFCHFALETLHLMPRLIGYQGARQKYGHFAEDFWAQERLCEAFADAMLLYRRNVIERIEPDFGTFLFEDKTSVGNAEAAGFSCRRIQKYLDNAEAMKRNFDLRGLRDLLAHQERYIAGYGFQQELPTNYYDSHREPYVHYVETDEPCQQSLHHGKTSWTERHLQEIRLIAQINALREEKESPQLSLFKEHEQDESKKFERELKLIDRAVRRFQNYS